MVIRTGPVDGGTVMRGNHPEVSYCILDQFTQKLQEVQSSDNRDVQVSLAGYTEHVA